MKLIDKNITDIVAGYDAILRAETELRSRWRPELLAAYARRRGALEAAAQTTRRRQITVLLGGLLGLGFILTGIGAAGRGWVQREASFIGYCCSGPLLALFGLLILGAAWFARRAPRQPEAQRVPRHPLRSKATVKGPSHGVFPDLRAAWMEGLSGGLKDEVPDYPDYRAENEKDHGAQGERLFIRRLQEHFGARYYVLARAMQRPREDVDVILVGPKGVWVFEVKHWSGEVYWDAQGWRRVQTYYQRGGVEVTRQPEIGEPPDQQWQRAAAEVRRTLARRAPKVLARYPALAQVRGGIVFTKDDATLNFQPGRPVFWGTLNFWIKTLHNVEIKAELDTRSTLTLVETLLARHHKLAPNVWTRSMRAYTQGVVQEAEDQLAAWVAA